MDVLETYLDMADKIIVFRKRFNIKQAKIAEILNVSRATVSNYENLRSKIPDRIERQLKKIFKAYSFEINYEDLYEEEKFLLYRIRNKLNQNEIAKLLGYNSKYYSLIETGNSPITTQFVNRFKSDILNWRENDSPVQYVL